MNAGRPTFSDGQRVRCTDDTFSLTRLVKGESYTVDTTTINDRGEWISFTETTGEWHPDRFEAVAR